MEINSNFNNEIEYNILDLFKKSVFKFKERPALHTDNKIFTYEELNFHAENLSFIMPEKGKYCALLTSRNENAYVSILSSLMANKTYLPLNLNTPVDRLVKMLNLAQASLLVVDESTLNILYELLSQISSPQFVVIMGTDGIPKWASEFEDIHNFTTFNYPKEFIHNSNKIKKPNLDAYLLFTSGSTGVPKGVVVSHKNVLNYLSSVIDRYQPNEYDRFSQIIDLTFDLSVHDIFLCWSTGACLYSYSGWDFLGLSKFIKQNAITFWLSVPSTILMMDKFNCLKENSYPSLRTSLFCGEPLSHRLAFSWSKTAPHSIVENIYGPTEATIAFTAYRFDINQYNKENPLEIVSIGKAFPGQKICIVDSTMNLIEDNRVGELLLSGSQVVAGYLNDTKLTNERFIEIKGYSNEHEKWYLTGDLVCRDSDGNLLYKGRIDDQWQIRGFRVEKLEIEIILRNIAKTESAAIVPIYSNNKEIIIGVLAYISNSNISDEEIIEKCSNYLHKYFVPMKIIRLDSLPINKNGKIDYKELKEISI